MVLGSVARFRREGSPGTSLIEEPTIGSRFFWAQTLPLRKPFSGLPPFGLTAGLVFALVVLTWRLIDAVAYDSHNRRGIFVWLAQNASAEKRLATQPEPIIVRIGSFAPGKEPRLYLDGAPLLWTELERSSQRGIGRPTDCRVLVTADEDSPWYDALQVMDVARGLGCKAVLLTRDRDRACA